MKIELLYFEGCPHAAEAEAHLGRVLERLAPDTGFEKVDVETEEEAQRTGFLGSPSIRIDGRDLERPAGGPAFLGCRVYEGGSPPEWMIEAAVLRALGPKHVLFLCVANSARSQLAEAIARSLAPEGVRISSAGSAPARVRPEAVRVLAEIGLDASGQRSKSVDDVEDAGSVDAVVTLCAEEVCPLWLATSAHRLHWPLPDPAAVVEPEARLEAFRHVRDSLARRLAVLFAREGGEP